MNEPVENKVTPPTLQVYHSSFGRFRHVLSIGRSLRRVGPPRQRRPRPAAFTLVELLVTMAVLMVMVLMLAGISNQITTVWRQASGRSETFREARDGFEAMTRRLSQATLNTYYDYYDKDGKVRSDPKYFDNSSGTPTSTGVMFIPASYQRTSELRFISGVASSLFTKTSNGAADAPVSGQKTAPQWATHAVFFQAPLGYTETNKDVSAPETDCVGLSNLLNTWGYYTEYTSDSNLKPAFISNTHDRFRLMELSEPTESLTLYQLTSGKATLVSTDPNGMDWFRIPLAINPVDSNPRAATRAHVLAENIVALILLPQLSRVDAATRAAQGNNNQLSPNYSYDSTRSANNTTGTTPTFGGKPDSGVNPKNQLPPVVQVTMIAVDEPSAMRLEQLSKSQSAAKTLALDTHFANAADTASNYQMDLDAVEANLVNKRFNYRIFTSQVPIRAARWSVGQTK